MKQTLWFEQLRVWLYKMWLFTGLIALIAVASGAHIRVKNTQDLTATDSILTPKGYFPSTINADQCLLTDFKMNEKSCSDKPERRSLIVKKADKSS